MKCTECPYRLVEYSFKNSDANYYLNNLSDEDIENYIWCDKIGGRVKWLGRCSEYSHEDLYDERHLSSRKIKLTAIDYKKKKFRNRKNSENKYKAHLKFLADNLKRYPSPVYPVDRNGKPSEKWNFQNGSYTLGKIARYKRCWLSKSGHGNLPKYYKKTANRAVRRDKSITYRGGSYRKIYDYWWNVI